MLILLNLQFVGFSSTTVLNIIAAYYTKAAKYKGNYGNIF